MATTMVRRRPHAERSGRFRVSHCDVGPQLPVSREGRATCGVFGASFCSAPVCRMTHATCGYSCAVFCITPPASTPLTTPSPTPESAEATASPTPGPTCSFDVIPGDCGATYSCITSPNYMENYAPEGSCVIKIASLTLDVMDFETEVLWDTMETARTTVDRLVLWVLRQSVGSLVFQMELAEKWFVYLCQHASSKSATDAQLHQSHCRSDGECDVVGFCVHSPNHPPDYGSNQACDIRLRSSGTLLVDDFAIENSLELLAGDTDNISVISDPLLVLVIRLQHKPQGMAVVC